VLTVHPLMAWEPYCCVELFAGNGNELEHNPVPAVPKDAGAVAINEMLLPTCEILTEAASWHRGSVCTPVVVTSIVGTVVGSTSGGVNVAVVQFPFTNGGSPRGWATDAATYYETRQHM
jgi:hypothetical protein